MAERTLARLQRPDEVYSPQVGDVLCDAGEWLVQYLPEVVRKTEKIVHLSLIHPNSWKALRCLRISAAELAAGRYVCPYTLRTYNGLVPYSVVTVDPEKYRKAIELVCGRDPVVLDFEYLATLSDNFYAGGHVTDVQRLLLGSGYTEGTRMSDGDCRLKKGAVLLTNGDHLQVHFWEWYNK
jgi:hypothetical protein